jgi:dephospho-CoA kinase
MTKIIGITGSIGMGKSTISSMLLKIGIPVFDSDAEVGAVLNNNIKIINQIYKRWPRAIVINKDKKTVNKKILGDIIFKTAKDKLFLESLIHPLVQKQRDLFIKLNKNKELIALDIPLLFETKAYKICDYVLIADASNSIQRNRVLKRSNMTKQKFQLIKKNQFSNKERKRLSPKSFLITTNFGKLVTLLLVLTILLKIYFAKKVENKT